MQKQRIGVLIASERPQIRDFFEEMVKKEGALAIGQARDIAGVLKLARHLRPDAVVIDPCLPHTIGLDAIRLSRTGGLDAAQMISEEITSTQVILVNNLDDGTVVERCLDKTASCFFTRDSIEEKTPLRLQELSQDMRRPSGLIFARVEAKPEVVAESEVVSGKLTTPEKLMLIGSLCIFGGWFLTLTVVGALVGFTTVKVGRGYPPQELSPTVKKARSTLYRLRR